MNIIKSSCGSPEVTRQVVTLTGHLVENFQVTRVVLIYVTSSDYLGNEPQVRRLWSSGLVTGHKVRCDLFILPAILTMTRNTSIHVTFSELE